MIWPFKRKKYWFMSVYQHRQAGVLGSYENYVLRDRHPFDYLKWMNRHSNYTYFIVSFRILSKSEFDSFDSGAMFNTFNKIEK
jgi:hypothetical protein